jgi:hypothetical protein
MFHWDEDGIIDTESTVEHDDGTIFVLVDKIVKAGLEATLDVSSNH